MADPAYCAPEESERWRARLIRALRGPAGRAWDAHWAYPENSRPAGVLIPIVGARAPFVYFTQRSDALRHHAGQLSFPGGSREAADADIQATALREAHEEIGLDPDAVTILGPLTPYPTGTGFVISPFVGWVDPKAQVAADHREVARLFGVPFSHALDHRHFRRHWRTRGRRAYPVYSIDYQDSHIWGATAGILYGLLQRLAWAESRELGRPLAPENAGDGDH